MDVVKYLKLVELKLVEAVKLDCGPRRKRALFQPAFLRNLSGTYIFIKVDLLMSCIIYIVCVYHELFIFSGCCLNEVYILWPWDIIQCIPVYVQSIYLETL